MSTHFSIVVAIDAARGIGRDGALPWRLPREMAYFKRLTSEAAPGRRNAVIMGRKTWLSIAPKFRPLAGRLNVVLSRDPSFQPDGALRAGSLDEALAMVERDPEIDQCFVIGGGAVYRDALADPRLERIYLTQVHAQRDCDTHLPAFDTSFRLVARDGPHVEGDLSYTYEVHARKGASR